MSPFAHALIAAIAMVAADIIAVVMVQAEAGNRGWLAGGLDSLGWIVGITTTSISVDALNGHNTTLKIWVIILVTAANLLGTKLGQVVGKKVMHTGQKETVGTLTVKVASLQHALSAQAQFNETLVRNFPRYAGVPSEAIS